MIFAKFVEFERAFFAFLLYKSTILLYLSFLLFLQYLQVNVWQSFLVTHFFCYNCEKKNGYQIFTTEFNPGGTLTLGKLLYQQNQDATYINKLTTNSFKQVGRIKMTWTQLCVYVDSLSTYSSSNNNGANILRGLCSLETSNLNFFPHILVLYFGG